MLSEEKQTQFAALRRQIIAAEFGRMNPRQLEGVLTTEGPLLLLAGAGSGKTTVLINRIANLLRYGRGADSGGSPGSYRRDRPGLSGRLRQQERPHRAGGRPRPSALRSGTGGALAGHCHYVYQQGGRGAEAASGRTACGPDAQDVWAATFHSACVRILRRDIEQLGFPTSFTIYDADDSQRVIKESLKAAEHGREVLPAPARPGLYFPGEGRHAAGGGLSWSQAKARGTSVCRIRLETSTRPIRKQLWAAGRAWTLTTLSYIPSGSCKSSTEAREYYQRKFRYVLIDEYQDTNHLQYLLAALLAGERQKHLRGGRRRPVYLPLPGRHH